MNCKHKYVSNDPCNPQSPIYNPCCGKTPANADFVIEEKVGHDYFKHDTINSYNFVRFRALYPADSYKWLLGIQVIKGDTVAKTYFPFNTKIPVTLIAYKLSSAQCFPKVKPIDTITKYFYSWPDELFYERYPKGTVRHYFPIYGRYYGSVASNPQYFYYVTLFDTVYSHYPGTQDSSVIELFKGIPFSNSNVSQRGAITDGDFFQTVSPFTIYIKNAAHWGQSPGDGFVPIPDIEGYANLDSTNRKRIIIKYNYTDTLTGKTLHDIFTGIKQ